MTNHDDGSSLIQTPAPDIHYRRDAANGHMHLHMYHHRQHNQHVCPNAQPAPKTPDPELDPNRDRNLRRRQLDIAGDPDSLVTRVVQTVSVIQYVDGTGSTLEVSTVFSPPRTEVLNPLTGATITPSPGSSPAPYPLFPSSSLTSTDSTPPVPTTFLSSVVPSPSLNSSVFPSLSGSFNSSSPSATLPFSNSTVMNFVSNTSSTSQTSISSFTTSESSSLTSTASSSTGSQKSIRTTVAGGAGGTFGPGGPPAPTGTVSVAPAAASEPPTPTSTIVGGVVGSICGVALLVFAVAFVLRWRKQQQQTGHQRLGDRDAGPPGSAGSRRSRGFSNRMSQRGAPFSVPAALAALSGSGGAPKQLAGSSSAGAAGGAGEDPEIGERGFYRVSGRKLPSVLQHGGDGYTNLHDSTMSVESDMVYRDSQTFFSGTPTRLAVGSPMRPESGISVMQPGPARTPVAGQSPMVTLSPTLSPLTVTRVQCRLERDDLIDEANNLFMASRDA
ncbi:hypothetical protein RB595_004876 [Gaeumannomyces hyphopodioides]